MQFKRICILSMLTLAFFLAGCGRTPPPKPSAAPSTRYAATGVASYYGAKFHGRKTASGERFDMHAMSAAHRNLPFGSRVRVTHLRNGRSIIVRINDRGPFVKGRIIDLSYAAAKKLNMVGDGLAKVRIQLLSP